MLKLFDNLYLEADSNQFILREKKIVKKMDFKTRQETDEDKEKITDHGYFSTFKAATEYAVNYAIKEKIADEELTEIKDVIKEIDRLYKLVDEMFGV